MSDLTAIMLLHLSRQCNAPDRIHELYAACAPELLDRLVVTEQFMPSGWVECGSARLADPTGVGSGN